MDHEHMNNSESNREFPCVRNCCLDTDDICLGCFRSLQEILNWYKADSTERKAILGRAGERRTAHRLKWGEFP